MLMLTTSQNVKKKAKDGYTLARMLLTEVFTMDALRLCALSKKNLDLYNFPRRGGISTYEYLLTHTRTPRPELDAYAEIIILNFVDEYVLEKGWPVLIFQGVRNGMLQKINEIRV